MGHLLKLLTAAACLGALIYIFCDLGGCGAVHSDRNKAMFALRRTELNILLTEEKLYKSEHGTLPATLSELTNSKYLTNIHVSAFGYNPTAAVVSGGKSWLLFTTNPV